jgi:hypothetical protein
MLRILLSPHKRLGISAAAIQWALSAESIETHHLHCWKIRTEPDLAPKIPVIIGLYPNLPVCAMVLSADE